MKMKKELFSLLVLAMFALVVFQPNSASAAVDANAIINTGKQHLGARYQAAGMSPAGFDCSGFTTYTFKQHGINLPRSADAQYQVGEAVSRDQLQVGDLVFFQTTSKPISHVGIYIGDDKFIHSASNGVVITSLSDPYYWNSRYVGAKRVL